METQKHKSNVGVVEEQGEEVNNEQSEGEGDRQKLKREKGNNEQPVGRWLKYSMSSFEALLRERLPLTQVYDLNVDN